MPSPRTQLNAHNLRARKELGQNFLSDPKTADAIVAAAEITEVDTLLEIGPGLGALTLPAARRAAKVIAVEKDARIAGLLAETLAHHHIANVEILQADILRLNLAQVLARQPGRLTILGNLPYNISSQVVVRLIQNRDRIQTAVLMFQKELAQRLRAPAGSRDYSRLTVMLRYCAEIEPVMALEAAAFFPKPKIDSEVLRIRFHPEPVYPAVDERLLFRVIRAAFGQRRKTLKNALAGSDLGLGGEAAATALRQSDIEPARRAETLGVAEFIKLAQTLSLLPAKSP